MSGVICYNSSAQRMVCAIMHDAGVKYSISPV